MNPVRSRGHCLKNMLAIKKLTLVDIINNNVGRYVSASYF